ncbi:exo1 protein [Colletotrichum truncatum]|uniref:Exo1 protein n=1 Tax=Colletotrichum truncatum TaxID=5467 RepID=A0ACC3Z658_COLTU|nr:exo1 protein [Colletotrichum truncatum]KAF6787136.1 exo1 protein [Colletotrichum truncatum]
MGVSGLLPLLKSIHRPTELKKFSGETLGVDAYGWLHRGAIACAVDLAQGNPTRKYVDFAMHRVRMLRHFGVKPYLVFDGDFLPSKAATEDSRAKRREDSKKLAMELVKAGKSSQAQLEFQKAIDVTPEMARNLIDELKKIGVSYVVAPYEADAQLVYLERQGLIDGILSEDSDLLVFGCKRLLTKLDQYGNCIEINRRDFCACREVSLTGWTDTDFRRMAILSGCDYLEGINNMGLKTAYRMLRKHKTPERLIRMIQFEGKHRVSENYLPRFFQAELTFIHQRVYCPTKKQMVCLTEPEEGKGVEDMPFIGAYVEPEVATAVAVGDINPMTKKTIIPAPMPGSKSDAKRRHSQSAEVLAANASSTRTRQPVKPIDSYFKGHQRIPMGEMDRNCFSVDPQRVAALTHNGLVPRVFPLPRPYIEGTSSQPSNSSRSVRTGRPTTSPRLHRRRTEPVQATLEPYAPSSSDSTRRVTLGEATNTLDDIDALMRSSSQRPPKKVRLCADTDEPETKSEESQKSKFFPKAGSTKTNKKDGYLFSDDSIDEALLSLPDIDEWHNPKPKSISVFEESQSTEATTSTDSQFSKDEEIATTPLSDLSEEEETSGLKSTALSTEASSQQSILQKFSYKSQPSPATSSQPETPGSAASRQSSIFTPSTAAPSTAASSITFSAGSTTEAPVSKTTPLLTPLQRLGARALQRKNPPPRRTLSPTKSAIQRSPRRSPQKSRLLKSIPVNPSFVPLPKVDLAEVEALNAPCGSEDQIIPNSDDENDDGLPQGLDETEKQPRAKALNLSRFVYS